MDIVVNNETLRKTIKCQEDFSCLKGEADFCRVEYCIDGKVHFVKGLSYDYCYYQLSFGEGYFCTCPTRKEIYNKYSI